MISAKTALTPKDLLLMVGGVFFAYLIFVMPARLFPVFKDPGIETVMAGMGALAAIYPFAKKLATHPKIFTGICWRRSPR